MYADQGNEKFEVHIGSQGKCNGNPETYNDEFDVSIYYYNDSASGTIEEEWIDMSIDPYVSNNGFDIDCSAEQLTVDLLTNGTTVEYTNIEDLPGVSSSGNKWHFGSELTDHDVSSPTTSFDIHDPGSVDQGNYNVGEDEELGFVVNHYLQLLGPQFDLTVTDGPGGSSRVDESASSGELSFDTSGGGQFITFLHITENRVTVSFD